MPKIDSVRRRAPWSVRHGLPADARGGVRLAGHERGGSEETPLGVGSTSVDQPDRGVGRDDDWADELVTLASSPGDGVRASLAARGQPVTPLLERARSVASRCTTALLSTTCLWRSRWSRGCCRPRGWRRWPGHGVSVRAW